MAPSIAIMPEHEALARRERRNHVDRRLGAFLLVGAAQRLAVNGDHIGRRAGQRRHPRNEAALKRFGIERRKNIAEVIVGGRPVAKRPEPAQQIDLLLAKPRDIHEGLRSAQNRK
jgi:5,10-methylenetetrahydrofolate reductase